MWVSVSVMCISKGYILEDVKSFLLIVLFGLPPPLLSPKLGRSISTRDTEGRKSKSKVVTVIADEGGGGGLSKTNLH